MKYLNSYLVALIHSHFCMSELIMSCCIKKVRNITATILCRVIAIHTLMQDLHNISDQHLEGAGERKHMPFELLSLPKLSVRQQVQAPLQAAGAQVSSAHIEAEVVSQKLSQPRQPTCCPWSYPRTCLQYQSRSA